MPEMSDYNDLYEPDNGSDRSDASDARGHRTPLERLFGDDPFARDLFGIGDAHEDGADASEPDETDTSEDNLDGGQDDDDFGPDHFNFGQDDPDFGQDGLDFGEDDFNLGEDDLSDSHRSSDDSDDVEDWRSVEGDQTSQDLELSDEGSVPIEALDDQEDELLVQIDAFRDKAKRLQELISAKENQVRQLDAEVKNKEQKNQELDHQIGEKHQAVEAITADVTTQVDRAISHVSDEVAALGGQITKEAAGIRETACAQSKDIARHLDQMTQDMGESLRGISDSVDSHMDTLSGAVAGRVDQHLEGVSGQVAGQVSTRLDAFQGRMDTKVDSMSTKLDDTVKIMSDELKEALSDMNGNIDHVKTDISDRVHKENVQSYRNLQDLIQELDHREEELMEAQLRLRSLKKRLAWLTVITAADLAGLVVLLLRVFQFI